MTISRKARLEQAKMRGAKIQARRNITQLNSTKPMKRAVKKQVSGQMAKVTSDYINLLTDPCNAPLVNGIYPGTGGIVSRFESDFIYGGAATDTAVSLIWVPGMNLVFAPSIALPGDNTSFNAVLTTNLANIPGYTFLTSVAGSFRCISACMQVTYPGTELNRSGVISLGIQDGSSIMPNIPVTSGGRGNALTVQQIRSMAQHTERTPATSAELLWMPGESDDQNFSYGNASPTPSYPGTGDGVQYQGRNAMMLSGANLSLAVGLRIRLVYVCEWTPRINQGIIASIQPSYSPQTVAEVLAKLAKSNPNWYIHASNVASTVFNTLSSTRRTSKFIEF